MKKNRVFNNRETEPRTAFGTRTAFVYPVKPFKQSVQMLRSDAVAIVG